jgi:hypothetical protein
MGTVYCDNNSCQCQRVESRWFLQPAACSSSVPPAVAAALAALRAAADAVHHSCSALSSLVRGHRGNAERACAAGVMAIMAAFVDVRVYDCAVCSLDALLDGNRDAALHAIHAGVLDIMTDTRRNAAHGADVASDIRPRSLSAGGRGAATRRGRVRARWVQALRCRARLWPRVPPPPATAGAARQRATADGHRDGHRRSTVDPSITVTAALPPAGPAAAVAKHMRAGRRR